MLLHFLFLISLVLCLLSSRTLFSHQFLRLNLVSLKNIIKFAYILPYFFFNFITFSLLRCIYYSINLCKNKTLITWTDISQSAQPVDAQGFLSWLFFFRRLSHASLNNPTSHSFHNYRK